jgi:hypothetical protein
MARAGIQHKIPVEQENYQSDPDEELAIIKDVQSSQRIAREVVKMCNKFRYEIMRCVNCPIILECKYPKKRLDPLQDEANRVADKIYQEELELDNTQENTLRAQNKRDYVRAQFIRDNAMSRVGNDRCVFEREEILEAIQKFVDAGYDITDPRTSLILNELIGNILNSGRANKAFTSLGVILKKETPAGPIYYNNPLLMVKMQFSKLIIESTEALDRILKSDEKVKSDKDFTSHLLSQLRLRETTKLKSNIERKLLKGD